jgi:hypothetical protein
MNTTNAIKRVLRTALMLRKGYTPFNKHSADSGKVQDIGIPRYSVLRLAMFRYSALASFPPFPLKYTAFLCVYTTAVCKPMARRH